MPTCPYPECAYAGHSDRSVSTHWAHAHAGPCPLTTEVRTCRSCGHTFNASKAMRRFRPLDYCSRDCWRAAVAVDHECRCARCGQSFHVTDSWRAARSTYCSAGCARLASIGRRVSRRAVQCAECGGTFDEIAYRLNRGRRFCSHACASKAKDSGRTPLAERYRDWEAARGWRDAVFARDDFTCVRCGVRGGRLHAHHRTPVSAIVSEAGSEEGILAHPLFAARDNGETLCVDCHRLLHAEGRVMHRRSTFPPGTRRRSG